MELIASNSSLIKSFIASTFSDHKIASYAALAALRCRVLLRLSAVVILEHSKGRSK